MAKKISQTFISTTWRTAIIVLVILATGWWQPERPTPAQRFVRAATTFTEDRSHRALDPQRSDADLGRAATEVLQQCARRERDAGRSYTCGIAALIAGYIGPAVDHLRNAANLAPHAPGYWSDLAVGLQELARVNDDPQHLVDALVASDTALRLRSDFPPALFTRASTLELMGINVLALRAYGSCLRVGANDPWARAALVRARAVRMAAQNDGWQHVEASLSNASDEDLLRIVRDYPTESLAYAEDVLLMRWANLELAGDLENAKVPLALARRLGRAQHEATTASPLAETVGSIDRAMGANRTTLALGHQLFGEARDAYRRGDMKEARSKFTRAGEQFHFESSTMWIKAGHLYNNCLDNPEVITVNMVMSVHGRGLDEGVRHDLDALATFERASDAPVPTLDRNNLADSFARLGHRPESWRERIAIFRSASKTGDINALQIAIAAAGRSEAFDWRWASAHALLGLAADAKLAASHVITSEALLWRAVASEHLGWHDGAIDHLSAARIGLQTDESRLARDIRFLVPFAEGCVRRRYDPSAAVRILNQFIDTTPAYPRRFLQHQALFERARAKRALNDHTGAIADLEKALDAIHPLRESAVNYRSAYGAAAEAIVDELVDILEHRGETTRIPAAVAALDHAYERVFAAEPEPLAAGVTVARYVSLPSRIIAIVRSRDGTRMVSIRASPDEIERAAGDLNECIRTQTDGCETWARRLGTWLLDPLPEIDRSSRVEIIADRDLARLPFAILIRSATNRRLIEDVLVFAPEIRAHNRYSQFADESATPKKLRPIVAVGDPAFDRRAFPSLQRLPHAEHEAADAARAYADGVLLTGVAATPERVCEALANARVANLAMHAVLTEGDPSRSCLLLAPSSSNSGRLYLHEIESLNLRDLDVVLLTGCHTAAPVEGEGSTGSLASAFLTAGAKNVVASLWDIEDEVARFVSAHLHRELLNGTAPAEALRHVQLSMMHSGDKRLRQLSSWGGLRIHVRVEKRTRAQPADYRCESSKTGVTCRSTGPTGS